MKITRFQIAAARCLLGFTQKDLAVHTDVKASQLSNFERGKTDLSVRTIDKLTDFIHDQGIEFIENDGVRRKPSLRELRGYKGFRTFAEDVLQTVQDGGDVCVANVDERKFAHWRGTYAHEYRARMAEISRDKILNFRILVEQGDDYQVASDYAQYKFLSKGQFANVPYYIYGHKVATILFDEDVRVFIHENKDLASAYRTNFQLMWDIAV